MTDKQTTEDPEITLLRENFDVADAAADGVTLSQVLHQNRIDSPVELENKGAPTDKLCVDGRRYQIGDLIGKGAMGAVMDARESNTCRQVAMKVMLQAGASDEALVRFIEEAQITAQLEHPNIVPIHELGVDSANRPYYTMKRVHGSTLKDILKRLKEGDSKAAEDYPLSRLLTIFRRICDAVSFAHARGVVHRDLKPENVMVGDFGEVQVMDWGIAKIIPPERMPRESTRTLTKELRQEELSPKTKKRSAKERPDWVVQDIESLRQESRTYATMRSEIMGTPAYLSPEQACCKIDELDGRADIYSLGVILYEVLTLHLPHEGRSVADLLLKVVNDDPVPPAELRDDNSPLALPHISAGQVPGGLSAVAMRALAKDPADRYQRVADLQRDIERWQEGFATSAEHASPLRQMRLLVQRHRALASLTGIAGALLFLLVCVFMVQLYLGTKDAVRLADEAMVARDRAEAAAAKTRAAQNTAANEFITQMNAQLADGNWDAATETGRNGAAMLPGSTRIQLGYARLALSAHNYHAAASALEKVNAVDSQVGEKYKWLLQAARNCAAQADARGGFLTTKQMEKLRDTMAAHGEKVLAARTELMFSKIADSPEARLRAAVAVMKRKTKCNARLHVTDGKIMLDLGNNPALTDLSFLEGHTVHVMSLKGCGVADISTLKGMPLNQLSLSGCPVTDVSPLKGMKLEVLSLAGTKVSDISVLSGMPLQRLNLLDCSQLTDLRPLRNCKQLTTLSVPAMGSKIDFLRRFPKLKTIASHRENPNQTAAQFWEYYDAGVFKLMGNLKAKNPAYTYNGTFTVAKKRIVAIDLSGTLISDISPLAGRKLESVSLAGLTLKSTQPLGQLQAKKISVVNANCNMGQLCKDLLRVRGLDEVAGFTVTDPMVTSIGKSSYQSAVKETKELMALASSQPSAWSRAVLAILEKPHDRILTKWALQCIREQTYPNAAISIREMIGSCKSSETETLRMLLCQTHRKAGKWDECKRILDELRTKRWEDAEAKKMFFVERAFVLHHSGKVAEARAELNKALAGDAGPIPYWAKKLAPKLGDQNLAREVARRDWSNGCVLALPFGEDTVYEKSGKRYIRDLSELRNDGAVIGVRFAEGKCGKAAQFDGKTNRILVGDHGSLDGLAAVTVAMWIRCDAWQRGWNIALEKYIRENHVYVFQSRGVNAPDMAFAAIGPKSGGGVFVKREMAKQRGKWLFIVGVYTGNEVIAYCDGKVQGRKKMTGILNNNSAPLSIGGRGVAAYSFKGLIDEVAIWNRALSQDEVNDLYEYSAKGQSYCNAIGKLVQMKLANRQAFSLLKLSPKHVGADRTRQYYALSTGPPYTAHRLLKHVTSDHGKKALREEPWVFLHPGGNDIPASVTYELPVPVTGFFARAACLSPRKHAMAFVVYAGGKEVFRSKAKDGSQITVKCSFPPTKQIRIQVDPLGIAAEDWGLWIDPKVSR